MSSRVVNVLDNGYVRLRDDDVFGSDLSVVNAARVSFDKESRELTERDKRLIQFLAREGHTSPFRHAAATFEIYAPLMVARQWWKYVVGGDHRDPLLAWNESSRRYITEKLVFYIPNVNEWRSAPKNKKQGSGEPVDLATGERYLNELERYIQNGKQLYEQAIEDGIAPELARLFLPAYGMYVRWRWTSSLQGITHFLNERLADDAQYEIRQYAKAVYKLIKPHFPESIKALVKTNV